MGIFPLFLGFFLHPKDGENTTGSVLHYHRVEEILQSGERETKVHLPFDLEGSLPSPEGDLQMFEYLHDPKKLASLHAKFQVKLLAAKALFFVSLGVAALVLAFKL